ncbi:unnamed protein product [Trichobilharzia szidati]|nr:unnamed protein product [Trichobilharzia szidati]
MLSRCCSRCSNWDVHTFFVQMKKNADVLIILLSAIGMWLSSFPSCSQSIKVTKDSSSFDALFNSESIIRDLANSSYKMDFRKSGPVVGVLLYANWDADSNKAKSSFEAVQNIIPYNIFAVNCGLKSSLCARTETVRLFPQLNVHTSPTAVFHYSGPFTVRHLLNSFRLIGSPMKAVNKLSDLLSLILNHKVIVLGSFNFHCVQNMSDFNQFYQTSVATSDLDTSLQMNKDIVFSLSTIPQICHSNATDAGTQITLVLSCGSKTYFYVHHIKRFEKSNLLHLLSQKVSDCRKHATSCFNPVDITPLRNRRSNLWSSILRRNPILLLIGPHLTLAEPTDLPLYLLKVLKLSYLPHEKCHSFVMDPSLGNFKWNLSTKDSLEVLSEGAVLASRKRCRLAANCPRWWAFISSHAGIRSENICEQKESLSGSGYNLQDHANNLTQGGKINSTLSRILGLLGNNTIANDIIKQAVRLMYEISLYDTQNTMNFSSSLPNNYNGIDGRVVVEQLNFMCCHWYHVDLSVNTGESFNNECQNDALHTDISYEKLKSSVAYGLGCSFNRTLEFHTLDSSLQPTLAWEIGGYLHNSKWLGSNQLGAAIIDMQNENVFRLEEAVNFQSLSRFISGFHNSTLRPWLRHSGKNDEASFNYSRTSDTLVVDIKHPIQLENLIDQSFDLGEPRKNVILLYYSTTCVYSYGGNSALWQFEAAARFFESNHHLLFAKVDVSKMDLPWHLRVENIPCIIFFPANRSSYSSVFPMESISSTDLFTQLVTFVHEQINHDECGHEQEKMSRFQNSSRFAAELTSQLLESMKSKASDELIQLLHESQNICNTQSLSYSKTLCLSGIQKAVFMKSHGYHSTQSTSTKMLNSLEEKLNTLNDKITQNTLPFCLLTYNQKQLIVQSIKVYSKLWNIISKHNAQIVDKLKILSNYSYLEL